MSKFSDQSWMSEGGTITIKVPIAYKKGPQMGYQDFCFNPNDEFNQNMQKINKQIEENKR